MCVCVVCRVSCVCARECVRIMGGDFHIIYARTVYYVLLWIVVYSIVYYSDGGGVVVMF